MIGENEEKIDDTSRRDGANCLGADKNGRDGGEWIECLLLWHGVRRE